MTFDECFENRFGKAPKIGLSEALKRVDELTMKLYRAKIDLQDAENWLNRRKAALFAWQFKDSEKEPK